MKVAILIQSHKPLDYWFRLANDNPNVLFIIHLDKKVDKSVIIKDFHLTENIIFLPDELRVDVKWGGFSQVKATLNLFKFALSQTTVEYFHFVSGEDIILSPNSNIEKHLVWNDDSIFMDCIHSQTHQYRVRFYAPHVEKSWQRKIIGKCFTFVLKILDRIIPSNKKYYFGSQWFSIRRNELKIIIDPITVNDIMFFEHKLCPDEHFFQYLLVKNNLLSKVSTVGNNRYIVFDKNYNNGNNPKYLSVDELKKIGQDYWFARKVDLETQLKYYEEVNKS